ncbi:RelA/SpoT domain-containing protein [Burkholderia gladioli]|uniref:RelA/SpoT domain-containing protein n=1 Tax=Burkholderia gladioli TaxID=28095 RepID=UPI00163F079B|nr:RelA/SpoT domain-containing protein [Burkholderia gladioli]
MNEKTEKHRILTEIDESQFLARNRISRSDWSNSECSWSHLQEIAGDHESHFSQLLTAADFIAKTIQNFSSVHSVRWRVKDTDHLIEKIIRKRADTRTREKYENIDKSNYNEVVTDLIGVRALHLFKEDCIDIHRQLLSTWKPIEQPIAYTRKGDDQDFEEKLTESGFLAVEHKAGYRSMHYIVESKPTNRTMRAEIQVRTLFEEGWSEIDHTVRYPNFMNDPIVNYLLTIFNRIAGSADEMGDFVRRLAEDLKRSREDLRLAISDRDGALAQIQATVVELENARDSEDNYRTLATKLKHEVSLLRDNQNKEFDASALISENNLAAAQFAAALGIDVNRKAATQILSQGEILNALRGKILTAGKTLESLRIPGREPKQSGGDQEDN